MLKRGKTSAFEPPGTAASEPGYDVAERRALLVLARRALTQVVTTGTLPPVPDDFPPRLREPRGCFVTLEIDHQLRGCIGHIFPRDPLALAVIDNARNAASRDTRFAPVTAVELDRIELEISVLTAPTPLAYATADELVQRLRPGIDGVVLDVGEGRSTFLPQVWKKLPSPERFLERLAAKAGAPPSAWREPGVSIRTYQTEAFTERELGLLQ